MSDIQQYLLKADSDQAGAEQLVKKSAESRMPCQQAWCPKLTDR